MRRISYVLILCSLTLLSIPSLAQVARKPAVSTCVNPPAPTPGNLTQSTNLPNGDIMYYGRFLMYIPDGNSCAFTNRQLRLSLPRLQNDDPDNPTSGNVPVIQATVESELVGANDQMVLYSIIRGIDNPTHAFIRFDASAFVSTNTPTYTYYLNVIVIGHPSK